MSQGKNLVPFSSKFKSKEIREFFFIFLFLGNWSKECVSVCVSISQPLNDLLAHMLHGIYWLIKLSFTMVLLYEPKKFPGFLLMKLICECWEHWHSCKALKVTIFQSNKLPEKRKKINCWRKQKYKIVVRCRFFIKET